MLPKNDRVLSLRAPVGPFNALSMITIHNEVSAMMLDNFGEKSTINHNLNRASKD
jgi:hypothetical protein